MTARRLLLTLASTVFALGLGLAARADVVTSGRLQLSTHVASTAANHTFLFVSPSGVDANTDTIVLRYQSGFDLTSLSVPGDMDLGVDNDSACDGPFTEKAIAASAAAGTWGVAVSGQNITFTAPSDAAGGEITAGRCVRIRIGTNAVTGATGANRITNPGSTGSYEVDVLGAFSDHGMFAVAIASAGAVSVTATVTNPSVIISPPPPTDTTPPIISSIVVSAADTFATLTWLTNEPTARVVDYGLTTSYGASFTDTSYRTEHTQVLGPLTQDTVYHLRITATDLAGNSAQSADVSFATLDVVPPEIQNLTIVSVTETTVTLSWDVNDTVDAWIDVPSARLSLWASVAPSSSFTSTITGLTPGTAYAIMVHVVDNGDLEDSEPVSFTTLIDLPPSNVSNVALTAELNSIALSWENPTDADLASIVVRASTSSYPLTPTSGIGVLDALLKETTHSGLLSGTLYYYTIFARDAAGQYSSGATISGRTDTIVVVEPPVELPVTPPAVPPTPTPTPSPTTPSPTPRPSGSAVGSDTGSGEGSGGAGETDGAIEATTPSTQASRYRLEAELVEFRVANGAITLPVSPRDRVVHVLANRPLELVLLPQAWQETVVSAEVLVRGDSYLVQPSARFLAPESTGPLTLVLRFTDSTVQTLAYTLQVEPEHTLFGQTEQGNKSIGGVATLYQGMRAWDALPYAQRNPLVVAASDTVAWYAPVGSYRVRGEGSGDVWAEQTVQASYAIVAPRLVLATNSEAVAVTSEEEAVAPPVSAVVQVVEALREEPVAQAVATVSIPVATVAAITTVSTLATSFSLLSYIRYLFSAPLLLFGRRKRQQWGVVYDSLRKVPIDLAIVRLVDAATGRVVKSQVTDKQGRYFFQAAPGSYKLVVQKAAFTFPSALIRENTDGDWLDVYHGEPIKVQTAGVSITVNIPLDSLQVGAAQEPASVLRRRWLRRVQRVVAISGFVLALVALVLQPTPTTWTLFVLQGALTLLFARLARAAKPKGWGVVYDAATKQPITRAIVRIFEPKFNKLLDTQITDAQGHYAFLVGPNQYYATYQHVSYEPKELNPIDRRGRKEPGFVSETIGLVPKHA